MNPFIEAQCVIIGIFVLYVIIRSLIFKKEKTHNYTVVDAYLLQSGESLYYRSFRQLTLQITIGMRNLSTQKAVNLYLTEEGRFVEVFHLLFDKELTTLN